jgi:hypothetical protein
MIVLKQTWTAAPSVGLSSDIAATHIASMPDCSLVIVPAFLV